MNSSNYVNPLSAKSLLKWKPRLVGDNQESQRDYCEYLRNPPEELGLSRLTSATIPVVHGLGVWETVGALGIPGISVLDEIKQHLGAKVYRKELQFYDTNISGNVMNAFHALALDEKRYSFTPSLWEKPHGVKTVGHTSIRYWHRDFMGWKRLF